MAPQLAAAEANDGISAEARPKASAARGHVVAAQPQLAQLEVGGGPRRRRGHGLGGQGAGVVEVVDLHARAGHRQQSRRRARVVEGPPAAASRAGGVGRAEGGGQRARRRRRRVLELMAGRRAGGHAVRLTPRTALGRGLRRVFGHRDGIGGGDQRDVGSADQRIAPELQHVERLRRDQPSDVALLVLEGVVEVGHPHHGVWRPRGGVE